MSAPIGWATPPPPRSKCRAMLCRGSKPCAKRATRSVNAMKKRENPPVQVASVSGFLPAAAGERESRFPWPSLHPARPQDAPRLQHLHRLVEATGNRVRHATALQLVGKPLLCWRQPASCRALDFHPAMNAVRSDQQQIKGARQHAEPLQQGGGLGGAVLAVGRMQEQPARLGGRLRSKSTTAQCTRRSIGGGGRRRRPGSGSGSW